MSQIATCLERGWGSICTRVLLYTGQHRARESGGLRDQFSWSSCHLRGVPLRSRPVSQPTDSGGHQRHLHVPVLPQGVGGEVTAPAEQCTASFYRWTTHRGKNDPGVLSVYDLGASCDFLKGKAELEELNEVGELRKILAEYPVS